MKDSDQYLDLRFLLEAVDERIGRLLLLLLLEVLLDLRQRLVVRHGSRRLLVGHFQDVIPELRRDDARELPDRQRERHLVEFGNHLSLRKVAEVAALRGAAVLRMLLRELGEVSAALQLLQHRLDRSEERRVGKECRSRWSPY